MEEYLMESAEDYLKKSFKKFLEVFLEQIETFACFLKYFFEKFWKSSLVEFLKESMEYFWKPTLKKISKWIRIRFFRSIRKQIPVEFSERISKKSLKEFREEFLDLKDYELFFKELLKQFTLDFWK